MKRSNYEDIEIIVNYPENMSQIHLDIARWVGNIYGEIVDELYQGKIHPILFHLLEDEYFIKCFGKTKQELYHLQTENHL